MKIAHGLQAESITRTVLYTYSSPIECTR